MGKMGGVTAGKCLFLAWLNVININIYAHVGLQGYNSERLLKRL